MIERNILAKVPIRLEVPAEMTDAIAHVLAGEYDYGFSGRGLTVLDIGANVGAFSIWADMRWPGSTIYAYEPHPGTFAMLERNLRGRSNITGCNFAVSTLEAERAPFWTRYAGDGESGLAHLMGESFAVLDSDEILEVSLLHPGQLPPADVVKLDVEGAELDIIQGMVLSNTSLVFLEYQNARNRDGIKAHLDAQFRLVFEDSYPWDALLTADRSYRRSLSGDEYGHLCFANRAPDRMKLSEDGPELITPIAYPAGVAGRIAARLRRLLPRPGSRAPLSRGSA